METQRQRNPALDAPRRYWGLLILALSGFVTSFGAHIVATNLPAYAETVGAGAFGVRIGFVTCGAFALLFLLALVFSGVIKQGAEGQDTVRR